MLDDLNGNGWVEEEEMVVAVYGDKLVAVVLQVEVEVEMGVEAVVVEDAFWAILFY